MADVITIDNAHGSITDEDDQVYTIEHMVSWTLANPITNNLIVAPNGTGNGIRKKSNTSSPATANGVVREIDRTMLAFLSRVYGSGARVRLALIDVQTGRQEIMEQAILVNDPYDSSFSDSDDTFNVALNFEASPKNKKTRFIEV